MQHLMHWLRSGMGSASVRDGRLIPRRISAKPCALRRRGLTGTPTISARSHYWRITDRFCLVIMIGRSRYSSERLTLMPNNAWAWALSAPTHTYIGDPESAIARTERALRLSPRDLLAFYFHTSLCIAHYTAGAYREAVHWGQIALSENPRFTAAACRPQLRLARWATNLRRRRCCKFCYGLTLPSAPRFTLLGIHTAMSRGGNYWNSIFWPQGSHRKAPLCASLTWCSTEQPEL